MTRISENSKNEFLNRSMTRAQKKLGDLQIKGASLKKMIRPSDNPFGSVDLLELRSNLTDNEQFARNLNYAKHYFGLTEIVLTDLTDILIRAKELAVAQASDTYGADERKNVAKEVDQLYKQLVTLSNKKIGDRYLFAGYATHQRPFDNDGRYWGDNGRTFIEIKKDFFIPINLTGEEIFFKENIMKTLEKGQSTGRLPATFDKEDGPGNMDRPGDLFELLRGLRDALENGESKGVRTFLDGLDLAASHLIALRAQLGAVHHSMAMIEGEIGDENVAKMAHKSKIEDADMLRLFSELEKQNHILEATYKSGLSLVDKALLDFL
ncbi:MAG: flagellar hook-associated protein FlgL [Bacteriovoracales bacterium]|nr:flagellar hook-associated protein FlgL [Bacteriovoracales bacterium]